MLTSATALLKLVPRLLKRRDLSLTLEYSTSLAWLILRHGEQEMTVTFHKGDYRINAREGYEQVGYIPSLVRTNTPAQALKTVAIYFDHGYDQLFVTELQERCASKEPGIPLAQAMRHIRRYNKRVRKTPPQSLEIPPSLCRRVAEKTRRKKPAA